MASPAPVRTSAAFVGGFVKPRDDEPHGTSQSAYLTCQALARHGGFSAIDLYVDHGKVDAAALARPPSPPTRVFQKPELRRSSEAYAVIYVANGEQRSSAPHVLRPAADWAPVVCTVGTAHHPGQWMHLLVALASGAIRPSDGWVFKSRAALRLWQEIWAGWSERLGVVTGPQLTAVIPNGVDVDTTRRSAPLRARMRRELRIADQEVMFLAFSRLSPATKGDQQALIIRWQEVVARAPQALLVLAGAVVDRSFVAELRQLARAAGVGNRVLVLGNPYELAANAREQLMSAADVFVHASTGVEEASPLVVAEAMAHGLPVIAADWAGLPEVVIPDETGFLIEARCAPAAAHLTDTQFGQSELPHAMAASRLVTLDMQAFVQAAAALAGSPELRERLGQGSRRRAEAGRIEVVARAYLELFARARAEAEASWARDANRTTFRPLVPLDVVLQAQAGRALDPAQLVRPGAWSRLQLLGAGWPVEPAHRLQAVRGAFEQRDTLSVAELARAVAASDGPVANAQPDQAYPAVARLLVRLLNTGVLELVSRFES